MEDIMKIVKSLKDPGLLLKGVSETTQNEEKQQKGGFLRMLLGTSGASLLGIILAGKGIARAGYGSQGGKGIKEQVMDLNWIFNTASAFN